MTTMRTLGTRYLVYFSILLAAHAAPAAAQDAPRFQVSGGYLFLHVPQENVPRGWTADVVTPVSRHIEIAGNLSGSYAKVVQTFSNLPGLVGTDRVEARLRLHGFVAGPRLVWGARRAHVFAQMLAGAVHVSQTLRESITVGGQTQTADAGLTTEYRVALQPGGGVIIPITNRMGAQAGIDYRRILYDRGESEGDNEIRFSAGVTVTVLR